MEPVYIYKSSYEKVNFLPKFFKSKSAAVEQMLNDLCDELKRENRLTPDAEEAISRIRDNKFVNYSSGNLAISNTHFTVSDCVFPGTDFVGRITVECI